LSPVGTIGPLGVNVITFYSTLLTFRLKAGPKCKGKLAKFLSWCM
jgi:hypothetical protein